MQRNAAMIGVLLVIAAGNAWIALVERELPKFHLTISGIALVLAVLVAISRYDFPVRAEAASRPTRARMGTGLAVALSASLAIILWMTFGPWEQSADFDVTGFLFLIQNIWQLLVLGGLVAVACAGLIVAFRP